MKTQVLLPIFLLFTLITSIAQDRGDLISTELIASWTPDEQKDYMQTQLGAYLPTDNGLINSVVDVLANGVYAYNMNIYKVRYWTQDLLGNMVQATGAMTIPQNDHKKTMILFGRGHIYDEADVFSNLRSGGTSNLFATAYSMINFIVMVPDNIGCGDGQGREKGFNHTEGANAMVDMYRAGLKITNALEVKRNGQVFVGGYSQGGGNAMATIKYLQETELLWDELPVDAAIFGGGPYDFGNTTLTYAMAVEESMDPEYYFMFIRGAKDAGYPIYDDPHDIIDPKYWEEWDYYIENDIIRKENIPTRWKEMFNPEAIVALSNPNGPLFEYAKTLDVFDWRNHIPITMAYGGADTEVPYQNAIIAGDAIRNRVPWYSFWQKWIVNTRNFGTDVDHRTAGAFTLLNTLVEFGLLRNAYDAANTSKHNNEFIPEPLYTTNLSLIKPVIKINKGLYSKSKRNISDIKVTSLLDNRDIHAARLDPKSKLFSDQSLVGLPQGSLLEKENNKKLSATDGVLDMTNFAPGIYIIEAKVNGERKTELYLKKDIDLITNKEEVDGYFPLQKKSNVWTLDLNYLENPTQVTVFDDKKNAVHSFSVLNKKEIPLVGLKTGTYTIEVLTNNNAYYIALKNEFDATNTATVRYLQDTRELIVAANGVKTKTIRVFNIRGRLVQSFYPENDKNFLNPTIKKGIYIIKINLQNGKTITHKISIK